MNFSKLNSDDNPNVVQIEEIALNNTTTTTATTTKATTATTTTTTTTASISLPSVLSPFQFPSFTPDEGFVSETWSYQNLLERKLRSYARLHTPCAHILRNNHVKFLLSTFKNQFPLPYMTSLHASQPWLCYWTLQSLDILNALPKNKKIFDNISKFLYSCIDETTGGFGGGPGQIGHLATTYASVMSLCILGEKYMKLIDRNKMIQFLKKMKDYKTGGFFVTSDGENDIRGLYFAVVIGRLLGLDCNDEIWNGCQLFCKRLQGFDGGIGGEEFNECHGGYTYCGVASMLLLDKLYEGDDDRTGKRERGLDVGLLREWAVMRQMRFSGGFQGRCNKLVDSCYSFWVGATLQMLGVKFDGNSLLDYLLRFSQVNAGDGVASGDSAGGETGEGGGWRDKPGEVPDLYHTCYALCGASLAQHWANANYQKEDELKKLNVMFCLCEDTAERALRYFCRKR